MFKIIGIAILTAFAALVFIGMAGCRTTKNISKAVQKALHTEVKDSSGASVKDSAHIKKDSSRYNTEITVTFDTSKLMEGADPDFSHVISSYEMPDEDSMNRVIISAIGSIQLPAKAHIRQITVKTNGSAGSLESSLFHSSDTTHKKIEVQNDVEEMRYARSVKRFPFYWWLIIVGIIVIAVYYYRKQLLAIIKKIPL